MKAALAWLQEHDADLIADLAKLVAIQSISTDGAHAEQIVQTAELTCELMRKAGLQNVTTLKTGDSAPYAYGEWLGAPGKPTVFLYAHHDVQPVNYEGDWKSPPWELTEREGRLFGRGAADDKGAIVTQLGAVAAWLQTTGSLPCNVKMLVEGEEEVGSKNLQGFFQEHRERLLSDVIIVCDTSNIDTGLPCITYSLRGVFGAHVEVRSAKTPVHSGTGGGLLADAALALNGILARLLPKNGKVQIPSFYDKVRKLTPNEKRTFKKLPGDEAKWREEFGVVPSVQFPLPKNVHAYEQTWRQPAVTVIAQEASSIKGASNQVLPTAEAVVSCRIVPDMNPDEAYEQLKAVLTKDPPYGVEVTVKPTGAANWWITDPNGPAFEAAMSALKKGFGVKASAIGCGGSIGFVGPLAELFGGAPALLLGIEDPKSNAHAPNESLDLGDFRKLTASLTHLFANLGALPEGKVKAEPEGSLHAPREVSGDVVADAPEASENVTPPSTLNPTSE
ncbi:MAG: M20/M25/M40 family metallo-hydrolase [Gemmataceae bacterium]